MYRFTRLDRVGKEKKKHRRDSKKMLESAFIFQTDPDTRIIVVDLKFVSNGLNLYAANLVLFMEPVTDQSLMIQAVGRAARIGQTRRVEVETLLLEGSIEDPSRDTSSFPDQFSNQITDRKHAKTRQLLQQLRYLPLPADKDLLTQFNPWLFLPTSTETILYSCQPVNEQNLIVKKKRSN